MIKTVLCYIENNEQYLMLLRNKKNVDINKGKWIGVGGHIEKGESKEEALIREVKEETNLKLNSFKYRGEILFVNNDFEEIMYLYTSSDYSGEIKECDEGELKWIKFKNIPSLNLWEGDRIFLPRLIKDNSLINLELYYDNDKLIKVIDREETK